MINELPAGILLDGSLAYWYWWRPPARPWLSRFHVEVRAEALRITAESLRWEADKQMRPGVYFKRVSGPHSS